MNWKRIMLYIVVLSVSTFVASFPFGFVAGYLHRTGQDIPDWLWIVQTLVSFAVVIIVFAVLAHAQREHTLLHALLVALYTWLLSFLFSVILLGLPLMQWILEIVGIIVMAGVGTGIGIAYRTYKERVKDNQPAPPVWKWYVVYCVFMALINLLMMVGALVLLLADPLQHSRNPALAKLVALFMLGASIVFFIPYAAAPFLPRRGWTWVLGAVLIGLGMTSVCTLPATIPLLISWLKPENKTFFERVGV